ncbi:MAG: alkaline phosphatase family protein [Candidatus Njordarchaeales archaeon]
MRKLYILLILSLIILLPITGAFQSHPQAVMSYSIIFEEKSTRPLGSLGIIIVIDALNKSLLEVANLTWIPWLMDNGITILDARTVLPSATTAAHAAMITGAPPEVNGIVHTYAYNATEYHSMLPDESPISYGYMDMLRVKTLLEAAKEANEKVALIVSKSKLELMAGVSRAADKILILPSDVIGPGDPHDASYPFEKRVINVEWITNKTLETLDEFAPYIIDGEKALIVVHYGEVDWISGALGVFHPDTIKMVEILDQEIGRIINKIMEYNLWSRTFFILTTDHSFVDVDINKNLLAGDITHLSAIHAEHILVETAGLSLFIYLKHPEELQKVVNELSQYPWVRGIWTRYPVENASGTLADIGLNIDYAGDIFLDIRPPYYASRYLSVGAHGGTATCVVPIIFAGGTVKEGVTISNVTIMHIGATMAKFLNVTLPNATVEALDILLPTASVSASVEPGIAQPGQQIFLRVNYSLSETVEGAKLFVDIIDINGSVYSSTSKNITALSGSETFVITISAEGSYNFRVYIIDPQNNVLGGTTLPVLVVKIEKAKAPIWPIVGSLLITIVLSGILIYIPLYIRKREELHEYT